jgi:hypothetical protein
MKNKNVFWGVFFISIGIFILINNLTSYHFYYEEVWKVWPVALILLGISMLIRHEIIRSILVGLTAFTLAFAIYSSFITGFDFFDDHVTYFDDYEARGGDYNVQRFSEEFDSGIKAATLNFDAGAGSFVIMDTTNNLMMAKTEGVGNYSLSRSGNTGAVSLDLTMKDKHFSFKHGKIKNKVGIKLNPNPLWDININAGAANIDVDLSNYKIRNLDIAMGAASLDVILGMPEKETNFTLDAGVSSIDIAVPEKAGCEIRTDVALSGKNFKGFKEVKDNVYQTENFNRTDKKIFLELKTGVSSITVKRSPDN